MSTPYHLALAHMHLRAELKRIESRDSPSHEGWRELLEITRQLDQLIDRERPPCATDRSCSPLQAWPTACVQQPH